MLINWEGGCYAFLIGKISSKGLVNLESEIGCFHFVLLSCGVTEPFFLSSQNVD